MKIYKNVNLKVNTFVNQPEIYKNVNIEAGNQDRLERFEVSFPIFEPQAPASGKGATDRGNQPQPSSEKRADKSGGVPASPTTAAGASGRGSLPRVV